MNEKILLPGDKSPIIYETLDHLWINQPFKFRLCPTSYGTSRGCAHRDIEFDLITEGALEINLDGRDYVIKKGELVFVNQYIVHKVTNTPSVKYTHMIISTKFLQENGINLSELWFQEKILADSKTKEYFSKLEEERSSRKPYFKTTMQGLILELIVHLARNYSTKRTEEADAYLNQFGTEFNYVKRAIDYISANVHKPLTVEEISNAVGISQYHFMRIFKKVTKYTLSDYINMKRCEKARTMILSGECTITEAALSSGFSNLSYFAKVFKKVMGSLPTEILQNRK